MDGPACDGAISTRQKAEAVARKAAQQPRGIARRGARQAHRARQPTEPAAKHNQQRQPSTREPQRTDSP